MRYQISEQYQQYRYFIEISDVRELKHVKVTTSYQGAKFPDAVQSKVELFLSATEWENLKNAILKS
jgi:hypothetical protein